MTRGEYSRYDLDEFVSGDIQTLDNLDFACWIRGWPYPWTVPAGADPYDPDNYGIVPVKYELTDEAVELRDDGDGVLPLTDEDYQIDSLIYDVRMRDAALGADKKFHEIGATYTDGDVISFHGKFSGSSDWVLMAQRNLKTGGNWYDAEYVSSMTASEILSVRKASDSFASIKSSPFALTLGRYCFSSGRKPLRMVEGEKASVEWS